MLFFHLFPRHSFQCYSGLALSGGRGTGRGDSRAAKASCSAVGDPNLPSISEHDWVYINLKNTANAANAHATVEVRPFGSRTPASSRGVFQLCAVLSLLSSLSESRFNEPVYPLETWSGESEGGLDSMAEVRKRRPKAENQYGAKRTLASVAEQRAECRKPKTESRKPKTESRKPKTESRSPKAEGRRPKADDQKPKTESRRPRRNAEGGKQEDREPKADRRRGDEHGSRMPTPCLTRLSMRGAGIATVWGGTREKTRSMTRCSATGRLRTRLQTRFFQSCFSDGWGLDPWADPFPDPFFGDGSRFFHRRFCDGGGRTRGQTRSVTRFSATVRMRTRSQTRVGRSVPFRARGSRSVPGRSVLPRSTWCRSWPKKMPPAFFASLEMQMSLVVGQCLRYFVRSTTTLREGKWHSSF